MILCNQKNHDKCLNRKVYKLTASEIINLYVLGLQLKHIAQYAGVSYQSVSMVLKKHGLKILKRADRDQDHHDICRDYLLGETSKQLTIKYNKSYSGIHHILKGSGIVLRGRELLK